MKTLEEQTSDIHAWFLKTRLESERGRECRDMVLMLQKFGCSEPEILAAIRSFWVTPDIHQK
jgi:hypothetical protein